MARPRRLLSFLMRLLLAAVAVLWIAPCAEARADDALVAVAANFKDVADRLAADFENRSDHHLTLAIGSTGKLYAQIVNGAPYDVMLAADQRRPRLLEQKGRAVAGSRFTYAVGRLTLWSPKPDLIGADGAAVLKAGDFRRIAVANPELAPYGAAAMQVLEALGVEETLRVKIVNGENIGQTFALIAGGGADLGFVALSYVLSPDNKNPGSRWDPPTNLYGPIRQDAVLLSHGKNDKAATAFLSYLKSDAARAIIARYGYGLE